MAAAAAAATAATATTTAAADGGVQLDSIPIVDLRYLSQSELYALSMLSPSSFNPSRLNDVVIPKIDRSIFNESAGSRKQTYSRLRLAPASSSSSSSTTTTIHRRTPHLRATNPSPEVSIHSDPENARIVTLLKHLFVEEETNNAELIPVRIDYADSLPQLAANVGPTGSKRKRGRPKRNENAVPLMQDEPGNDFFDELNDNVVMNEIVIYENMEDRDKEVVNRDGVAVDLVALAAMGNPYGEELWRRTEGLGSEEELLGFLKGLNGQWGSRRKKKRIVDASEFGNVLPRGWKLLLSIKKKEGRAWVYCRRYISPNGRQFASCNEVSSYLLSLHCLQDANQPNSVQSTKSSMVIGELASAGITDHSVQRDDKKKTLMCQKSSPTVTSISSNHEVQIMYSTGDLPKLPLGENFHCEKCTITFHEKDELLRHHFSSHKGKRSRGGQSITDGVIIKEGKYECQFCHKTFSERHRYNGHIGAHVRNQGKSANESACVNVGEVSQAGSIGRIPQIESMMLASITSKNNEAETTYLSQSTAQGAHYMETDSNMEEVKQAVDVLSPKSDLFFISEAVLSNDEKHGCGRPSVDTHASRIMATRSNENPDGQGRSSGSGSPSSLNNETHLVENNVIEVSASPKELRQEAVFENSLLSSNGNAETCDAEMKDWQSTHAIDEPKLDGIKVKQNGSEYGLCSSLDRLEERSVAGNKLHRDSEDRSDMNVNNVNDLSISAMTVCEEKRDSESIALSPFGDGEACVQNNVKSFMPSSQDDRKLEEMYFESNDSVKSFNGLDMDALASHKEQRDFDSRSLASSLNGQTVVTWKYESELSPCLVEQPGQAGNSTGNLLSRSGHQELSMVENYVEKVVTANIEVTGSNEVEHVRSSELLFPCSNNQSAVNDDSLGGTKQDRSLEFRSLFPSASEKTFCAEDNATGVYSRVEESKQEPSGNVFLMRHNAEASDKAFAENKTYAMDELRLNGPGYSRNDELSLGFSKPQTESGTNSIHFDIERYPAGSSLINSGMDQTYIVQTNMNGINHNSIEDPKDIQGFGMNLRDSSFDSKTSEFENNFNMIYPTQVWESSKIDVGNSVNKFSFSLSSTDARANADFMAGSIWGANEETVLQGGLTSTLTPVGQSSSCLGTFDIVSDKGEAELFRGNGKYNYNTGYQELGPGRNEPVEYSFMTTQSSNSLPGHSKAFSYDTDIGQGFDNSFWLGKDALMPNVTGRNQVPTICVWCGNEFYHDPVHSGTAESAIGSMCPNCSARIQFNDS